MEPEEGLNEQQSPRVKLSRRSFLALAGAVALSVPLMKAEAAAAKVAGKKPIKPKHYVTPPGIKTRKHFHEHCTGCHLCVSKCPQKVLRPATTQYGLAYAMQPVKDYDASYCRAGCTRCTNVCPRARCGRSLATRSSTRPWATPWLSTRTVWPVASVPRCARRRPSR